MSYNFPRYLSARLGIKDVIETAGMPTGQGSQRFAGTQTGRDAAAVLALREAGAVILGKTAWDWRLGWRQF